MRQLTGSCRLLKDALAFMLACTIVQRNMKNFVLWISIVFDYFLNHIKQPIINPKHVSISKYHKSTLIPTNPYLI